MAALSLMKEAMKNVTKVCVWIGKPGKSSSWQGLTIFYQCISQQWGISERLVCGSGKTSSWQGLTIYHQCILQFRLHLPLWDLSDQCGDICGLRTTHLHRSMGSCAMVTAGNDKKRRIDVAEIKLEDGGQALAHRNRWEGASSNVCCLQSIRSWMQCTRSWDQIVGMAQLVGSGWLQNSGIIFLF